MNMKCIAAATICAITPAHAEAHTWECWANSHDRFTDTAHIIAQTKHEPWVDDFVAGLERESELKSLWEKHGFDWQWATIELPGQKASAIYFFNEEFASHDFQFGGSPNLIFRIWVDGTGILFQSFATTPLQIFDECRFTK